MSVNTKNTLQGRFWRLAEWFPSLNSADLERLRVFHFELIQFNGRINLISPMSERHADQVHFSDSILGFEKIFKIDKASKVYDIGSGNGFPGLVGSVLYPETEFVLVEKDGRKVEFLKHAASRMQVKNVTIEPSRIEDLPQNSIECAVSRGFAPLYKALLGTIKNFRTGGRYYHFKGESWVAEVAKMPPQLMGVWQTSNLGEYQLPDNGPRLNIISAIKR